MTPSQPLPLTAAAGSAFGVTVPPTAPSPPSCFAAGALIGSALKSLRRSGCSRRGMLNGGSSGPLSVAMKSKQEAQMRAPGLKRFAVKLLFQFRVMINRNPGIRRLCEERIIVLEAKSQRTALARAKRRGRASHHQYENSDGNRVHFEFIGVLDLLELGQECEPGEVWYDLVRKVRPMERRALLLPARLNGRRSKTN